MSPEPFSKLAERFPRQASVWAALSGWARSHRDVQFLDASRLGKLLKRKLRCGPEDATQIVSQIFDSGIFSVMFAIRSPRGSVFGPWQSIEDVPDQIEDAFGYFDAEDGDVVPVLVEVTADAQPA